MIKERSIKTLPLDGGALPFHFINTVHSWRGENEYDYLTSYDDVLAWCAKVGVLKKEECRQLKKNAEAQPAAAEKAFQKIMQTRALLYHFFAAVAAADKPALMRWLPQYNKALHEALPHFSWTSLKSGVQFEPQKETSSLLLPLWLVLKAAHDLLLSTDHTRIKECPRCGWIFLDTTKNGRRRWCNPQSCGSIEKSKKYYRKKTKGVHDE